MVFLNFAVCRFLCMKPTALERKRCAQQFASNGAQFHPQNANFRHSKHRGVKLDTHVGCSLLRFTLSNPPCVSRLTVYRHRQIRTAGTPNWYFQCPGKFRSGTPRGAPKWVGGPRASSSGIGAWESLTTSSLVGTKLWPIWKSQAQSCRQPVRN